MRDFRALTVWQKAHEAALAIYKLSQLFPRVETYALTSQIRRAAASIPTNLAEGSGRGSHADFARFVQMSIGSASEVQHLLLLAHDLGYIDTKAHSTHELRVVEIKRMFTAFLKKLQRDSRDTAVNPTNTEPDRTRQVLYARITDR